MRRILPFLLALLIPIAALVLLMISMQTQLLFPTHAVSPPGPLPPGSEQVSLETSDGNILHGVHIPPAAAQQAHTLILGFGGNAWNGEDVASYLHQLYPEADVVAFHYRGYRPSTGSPSAEALLEDAPLVLDFAVERVAPQRTVAVGFSIGGGVAATLAKRDIDGLILVTPFDSLKAVASSLYPWLPIGSFFQHELNTVQYLRGSKTPVAIVAGDRDEIIPGARTEALRAQVPNLVFDRTIANAGHNDIYHRPEFLAAMREALSAL